MSKARKKSAAPRLEPSVYPMMAGTPFDLEDVIRENPIFYYGRAVKYGPEHFKPAKGKGARRAAKKRRPAARRRRA